MPTTQRLLTDETGQALVTAINNVVAAVKPNATEIQMSSSDTTTVATAITNINNKIGTVPSGQTVESQITTLNSNLHKNIDVVTMNDLEARILAVCGAMSDASTCTGCARINFSDRSIGLNGSTATIIYSRKASGVYIVNILQSDGIMVSDYYYNNEHHWGSLKPSVDSLNSKLTPQTMTVSYSGSVFGTHAVSATKRGGLMHISGYFANSSNTNAGIVAVVNSCYPVGTVGSVALPVQCDDNSVQYLAFESANNNLTIKTPTTLTANKYVRFDGFIECSQ